MRASELGVASVEGGAKSVEGRFEGSELEVARKKK